MKQTFTVQLIGRGPQGAWTHMDVPFSVEKAFGTKARVAVKGTINGFPFRSSLVPRGGGVFYMAINKQMRDGAGAGVGTIVSVVMEPDTAPRTVTIPPDLKKALAKSPAKGKTFAAFSYSHQKERVDWIEQAKRPETRAQRIAQCLTMLAAQPMPKD
ncbi:MAG TPA: YdeI/OmpD-associated family protein [Acidobacteriaceae bacterium]|jgi:hypothetical protein|nr:YdeI/OmpD-associated family protein [Acidobacteriaceae bacterium]